MKSSLTFLGTSSDPLVVGKGQRSSAGFVFSYNDTQLHIDPGSDVLTKSQSSKVDTRSHTGVIATKNSLHSAGGMNYLIDALSFAGMDKQGVIIAHPEVLSEQGFFHQSMHEHVERVIGLEPGKRVGVNEVDILGTSTHTKSAVGLVLQTPSMTIGYTGDTKYSVAIANQFKDASILVMNVPHLGPEKGSGMTKQDAIEFINHAKPQLAIISNFDKQFVDDDPVFQVRDIQQATGVQTIAAHDGLVISPNTYGADGGQQQLPKQHQGVSVLDAHDHLVKKKSSSESQQTLEIEDVLKTAEQEDIQEQGKD